MRDNPVRWQRHGVIVLWLVISHLCSGPRLAAQVARTASDSTQIMAAVSTWDRGWATRDAELASSIYTHDTDWTNAFGHRRVGRDSLQAYLTQIFRNPGIMSGSARSGSETHDLRFLASNIAVLRTGLIYEGQELGAGTEVRRVNHLRVFVKTGDEWLIASHLIMDERTPGRPR